jgi:hypothetical protein
MTRVALKLKDKTNPEDIEFARSVVTAMTGNANFPTPLPHLLDVTTAANELETAYTEALGGDVNKKAIQLSKRKTLDALLTKLGAYVQDTSAGDELIIRSAGMEVQSRATPVGVLPAPENLKLTDGGNEGSLLLKWRKVKKASSYLLQISIDDNDPAKWNFLATTTVAKYLAINLPSGTVQYFRIAATNAAGQSTWSGVERKRVG